MANQRIAFYVVTFLYAFLVALPFCRSLTIAVFGGSGFVGRRISENLVKAGHDVISISRSGKPPSYYCNDAVTADLVNWISYDLSQGVSGSGPRSDDESNENTNANENAIPFNLPKIDAAISCIGNVNPKPQWDKSTFFGLYWDDDRLYHENGILNEYAAKLAKKAGAERFVYISVSYEVAKMLEGPLVGYMDGKRHAEHVAYTLFGGDNNSKNGDDDGAIVLGPSLVYGGMRFSQAGDIYRTLVKSFVAKAYIRSNEALRNLSSAPMEDWVEKSLFSPPVNVDVVARVASAAALGLVKRDMVGERRQGFFNTDGKPVLYDDVVFVDGTHELERVDEIVKMNLNLLQDSAKQRQGGALTSVPLLTFDDKKKKNTSSIKDAQEPPFEGALVGKGPYLFPLPVVAFFSTILFFIANNPFVGKLQE